MIKIEHLSKRYGPHLALDDVSFTVAEGEILGFLGPNAAGKTTTMRILAGYFAPSSGRAYIAGYDVVRESLSARRRIGYLPENIALYPEMSVGEHLSYLATIRGVRPDQRENRTRFALERCNLVDVTQRLVGELSRGYRQRLGIAQAIVHDPPVLILDEPTVGLDPRQIVETRRLIRELGEHHTVLLSSHILPEVSMTCSRVLIIDRGRVVAEDTPAKLTERSAGTGRIILKVRGPVDPIENTIRDMPDALAVHSTLEDGLLRIEVQTRAGSDPREQMARRIVNGGWGLLEMRQDAASLEDIFVQLTTTEKEIRDD